jgi:hypothetical protein
VIYLIGSEHQTETETTINREINELRAKIDNVKEEVTQDMEKPQKKRVGEGHFLM